MLLKQTFIKKIIKGLIYGIGLFTILVACQSNYDSKEEFIRGYAVVSKDGKYGLINEDGEVVVPIQFEKVSNFIGEYARVQVGNKIGFVDKSGKVVIAPKYDRIYGFNGEYAKIELDGKVGLIDKQAKEVIAPIYDAVNYNIIGGYFEVAQNGEVKKIEKTETNPKG